MSEISNKTWGVGVELLEDHLGVLRFAAHLAGPDDRLIGVHVMPDAERLHPLTSREQTKQMREHVTTDTALMLERAGIRSPAEVRVLESNQPDLALVELARQEPLDALIIGRRARRDDEPMVRLGGICRRVLQRLPTTVIVVPPDFGEIDRDAELGSQPPQVGALGVGPIVLATNFEPDCAGAAEFAKLLAARLVRPIVVAHGTEAFNWGVSYIPAETFDVMIGQARREAATKLHDWVVAHGLEGAQEHVFIGDPARNLVQLAKDRNAAALVAGSRKLGLLERVFMASVSSELAASAPCPTAIVPAT